MGTSKFDLYSMVAQQGLRRGAGLMSDTEKIGQLKHPLSFWNSVMVGGLGAIDPSLSSQYLDTKLNRQNEWEQRQEGREVIAGIESAATLKTQAEQDAINKQLGINNKNLASTFAVSGGIRTGNYQRKVGELNAQAVTDVANVASQNALTAKMMELGYTQNVQQFNLELAKLESAKASGDSAMAMSAGENLASPLLDFVMGMNKGGELTTTNPEEIAGGVSNSNYNLNEQISGGGYPQYNEDPTLNYIRGLNKPKPKSTTGGQFAPTSDSIDILFGGG
jgi:hypothetical protein